MAHVRTVRLSSAGSVLVCALASLVSQGAGAETSLNEQIGRIESQIAELQAQINQLKKQAASGVVPANGPATSATAAPAKQGSQHEAQYDRPNDSLKPGHIKLGSSVLSLGGFVDASLLFRLHNLTADNGAPFLSMPFPSQGDVGRNTELRGSARASRVSLRLEDSLGPDSARLSAYGEIDFLGTGGDSGNQRQLNGYQPRLRQIWFAAEQPTDRSSFTLLAGQAYSLVTPSRGRGLAGIIQPDLPPVIDEQAVVGSDFARQWQVRVVKDFGDLSVGVSVENPQTLWGNALMPNGFARFVASTSAHSSLGSTPISLDAIPDVVVKLAVDKPVGRFELFGLGRVFRLDDGPNGGTVSTGGLAGGFNAWVPASSSLDLTGRVSYGTGLGRYGAAQMPDATSDLYGKPIAIKALHAQLGLVYHPSALWSAYLYGGFETSYDAGVGATAGQIFGYGNPLRLNNGCHGTVTALERGLTFCAGDTQTVSEITAGGWWTLYKGLSGRLQLGSQIAYARRTLFSDLNGAAPWTDNWSLYTSLRYTPFWHD